MGFLFSMVTRTVPEPPGFNRSFGPLPKVHCRPDGFLSSNSGCMITSSIDVPFVRSSVAFSEEMTFSCEELAETG